MYGVLVMICMGSCHNARMPVLFGHAQSVLVQFTTESMTISGCACTRKHWACTHSSPHYNHVKSCTVLWACVRHMLAWQCYGMIGM